MNGYRLVRRELSLTPPAPPALDDAQALAHYLAEGTPLRSGAPPVRVDMRRARWRETS